ncbi:MAG: hypothetical protein ACFFCW_41355 [Candidatus Hodarchaeota archaeon]
MVNHLLDELLGDLMILKEFLKPVSVPGGLNRHHYLIHQLTEEGKKRIGMIL